MLSNWFYFKSINRVGELARIDLLAENILETAQQARKAEQLRKLHEGPRI
jgi:hypothetical protein